MSYTQIPTLVQRRTYMGDLFDPGTWFEPPPTPSMFAQPDADSMSAGTKAITSSWASSSAGGASFWDKLFGTVAAIAGPQPTPGYVPPPANPIMGMLPYIAIGGGILLLFTVLRK
jgi:hypothetical protein